MMAAFSLRLWASVLIGLSLQGITWASAAPLPPQGTFVPFDTASREWVARDVRDPLPEPSGIFLSWRMGYTLGDPGGDGQWDFVTFADNVRGGGPILAAAFSLGKGGLPERTWTKPIRGLFNFGNAIWPTLAPYDAGGSLETAFIESPLSGKIVFVDNATWTVIGSLSLPPPPAASLPPLDWFTSIANVGDLDSDGFQDLSFTGLAASRFVFGLISGATRQVQWQHYGDQEEYPGRIPWVGPNEYVDLNGDGIPDLFAAYTTFKWSGSNPFEHRYLALSGVDGSPIWTHAFSQPGWTRRNVLCPDGNGDGIPEIFGFTQATVGSMALVDGATGQTIWEQPNQVVAPLLPPGWTWSMFDHVAAFTASLDPAEPFELCVVADLYNAQWVNRRGFIHLSPLDGLPLEYVEIDGDLSPWSPNPMNASAMSSQGHYLVGDVDADGFQEVGRLVPDLSFQGTPSVMRMVILGQRTLFGPDEVAPGDDLVLNVIIPSAPGQTLGLLASTAFAPDGGEQIDGWPTYLGPSAVYNGTLQSLLRISSLGPTGRGRLSVRIPGNSALSGRQVFLRGVVTDPASSGKVTTLTSLHTIQVR